MENEKVSIIMPAYNCEKYIADSIESVLSQTYTNWELIIVDDCSTDKTTEIIESFNDERIILLHNQSNLGAALTRNIAIAKASGEWIAFLDSDDVWVDKKLEVQLSFMRQNGYVFTYTDYRIQLNGKWLPYINTGPNVVTKRKLYNYDYMSTITIMYKADAIGIIQIADIKKRNDYALWLKAIEKANCYRLPQCLSYYIKHENSISSGSKIKLIKYYYIMYRKVLGKTVPLSILLTFNNLIHGVIKRYRYRKPIKSSNLPF